MFPQEDNPIADHEQEEWQNAMREWQQADEPQD